MTPEQIAEVAEQRRRRAVRASEADAIWGGVVSQMIDEFSAKQGHVRADLTPDIRELDPDVARAAGCELAALIIEQSLQQPRGPADILADRLHNLLEKSRPL